MIALPEELTPEKDELARKRILLADDDADFLAEIQQLLSEVYEIVGAMPNGQALVSAAQARDPDLIISDISMPVMSGFEAAAKVNALSPGAKLIFLTVQSSPAYVKRAHSLGAMGYVLKDYAAEQLLEAITCVLAGGVFVSPEIGSSLNK